MRHEAETLFRTEVVLNQCTFTKTVCKFSKAMPSTRHFKYNFNFLTWVNYVAVKFYRGDG